MAIEIGIELASHRCSLLPGLHIQRAGLLGLGTSLVVRNLVVSRPSTGAGRHTTRIGREATLPNDSETIWAKS